MSKMVIICIEGPDAVGKTTQVKILKNRLSGEGYRVKLQEIPANGFLKKIIYHMLNNGLAKRWPTTFQLLHFLNRFLWQYMTLPFIKNRYDFLILGRWSISSIIYGSLEGVNKKLLSTLQGSLLNPDSTFILYGQKFFREQEEDVYEKDVELQKNVERLYKETTGKNVYKIDNTSRVPSSICDEIMNKLGF